MHTIIQIGFMWLIRHVKWIFHQQQKKLEAGKITANEPNRSNTANMMTIIIIRTMFGADWLGLGTTRMSEIIYWSYCIAFFCLIRCHEVHCFPFRWRIIPFHLQQTLEMQEKMKMKERAGILVDNSYVRADWQYWWLWLSLEFDFLEQYFTCINFRTF